MWSKRSSSISESLRELRARVLSEGEVFFRVIDPHGTHTTDFFVGDDGGYSSARTARHAAFSHALDLASYDVGVSVFVSERRRLDGVQVCAGSWELNWSFLDGCSLQAKTLSGKGASRA